MPDFVRNEPGGVLLFECVENHDHDALELSIDLVVPDAQNPIACALQVTVSRRVTTNFSASGMLASVNLDDESRLAAFEIYHIGREGGLAAKVISELSQLPKVNP